MERREGKSLMDRMDRADLLTIQRNEWIDVDRVVFLWPLLFVAIVSSFFLATGVWFADPTYRDRLDLFRSMKVSGLNDRWDSNPEEVLRVANEFVFHNTQHDPDRQVQLWENWVQWIAGQFYSPLLRTQDPRLLAAYGKGDCSERAGILQWLLAEQGIASRFVGLGGHVVLEAEAAGSLWTLDPDYGLLFPSGVEAMCEASALPVQLWLAQCGIEDQRAITYEAILRSADDNVFFPWNSALSPRLKIAERVFLWIFWCLPAISWLTLLGFARPN